MARKQPLNILILTGNSRMMQGQYGGAERSTKLYASFPGHKVTVISVDWADRAHVKMYPPNIRFYSIPSDKSRPRPTELKEAVAKHREVACWNFTEGISGVRGKIKTLLPNTDVLILDYIGPIGMIKDMEIKVPIVYLSHNCEVILAEKIYGKGTQLTKDIETMEAELLRRSQAYVYCGPDDVTQINKRFKHNSAPHHIPNGTDLRPGIAAGSNYGSKHILFVGSGHPPNVVACRNIIPVAEAMPEYTFDLVGEASNYMLEGPKLPPNVKVWGKVNEEKLNDLFSTCEAFINPMETGSGTHLKLMRALSYGMPVITSDIGARGFTDQELKDTITIASKTKGMTSAIESLKDKQRYTLLSSNSLQVVKTYSWEKIQGDFRDLIEQLGYEYRAVSSHAQD
jgi:glycosyltransferase involved in cell wall biosynthesis